MKRVLVMMLVTLCPAILFAQKDKDVDLGEFLSKSENNTRYNKMPTAQWTAVAKKYPLLASIEKFDPTKSGKAEKPFTETYDYRMASGASLPPTLVDCFITDLTLLYKKEEGTLEVTSKSVPAEAAQQAMDVYRTKEANDIAGYRPFTHWNFVRSLDAEQQRKLADEVESYAMEYGIREK